MGCILGARFNMTADILRPTDNVPTDPDNPEYGTWVESQDPLTGDIIMVWVPATDIPDDPNTPSDETKVSSIKCVVRGVTGGGAGLVGNREEWARTYENVELINMWYPANVILTKRDRVINVRDKNGKILWVEEEDANPDGNYRATVFDVLGVTPMLDPFNNHVQNFAVLQRAETF